MNEISILHNFIIEEFRNNDLVNTISIVPTLMIDTNQFNIYPLVNVDLVQSEVTEQQVIASFIITVVQQRDTIPNKTDNKLLSNTNYLNNIDETHSILQRFLNVLMLQNNDENIELETQNKIKILKEWNRNTLDGVQLNLDLSIPNKGTSC